MSNPVIDEYGDKMWYSNGKIHRDEKNSDGESLPAIEYANGDKSWFINGKCHRSDGPAVEYRNGSKAYYINDIKITDPKSIALIDFHQDRLVIYSFGNAFSENILY